MENSNNLVQFINQEGSEFVINTVTGEAFISNSAGSRILEVAPTTFRRVRDSLKIEGKEATYRAGASVQRSPLLSASDFYSISLELRPDIAKQMALSGVNLFIYGHAGYKVSVVQESKPEPKTTISQTEILKLALERSKLQDATTNLKGTTTINNALIASQDQPCLPGHFTVWEELASRFEYYDTKMLNKKMIKRMGQAARLHTAEPLTKTKRVVITKADGSLKSITCNLYSIELLPYFEEILRQVVAEAGIDWV
jgi:hypothetical protein